MRVGEGVDNSSNNQRMWGPGRPRLSFGEQGSSQRQANRRRVFARLAPQETGEQLAIDPHEPHLSDSDIDEVPFVVENYQLAQPPTPPRRRSWGAVESSDDEDHASMEQPADTGEEQVRLALEQLGQLRRQRFMRDQRTRYFDTAALSTQSASGNDGSMRQHFPSNDVDSYWYNQPSPTSEVAPVSVLVPVHRVDRLQMQRYQPPPPPPPPVSRSHLLDELRRARLEVSRANNSTALAPEDEDDYSEQQQQQQLPQVLRRRRPAHERAPDKNGAGNDGDDRGSGMPSGRSRQPTAAWLAKHTVAARALDCSLLQPGMKFVGVQKVIKATEMMLHRGEGLNRAMGTGQWDVEVEVQTVDMQSGQLTGIMKALNVRDVPTSVVTCWEGEVVDFKNFMPLTGKWRASADNDRQYWRLFASLAAADSSADAFLCKWPSLLCGRRMPRLLEDNIYMRWKEESFVDRSPDAGLTIDGFYYICMNLTMRVDSLLNPAPTKALDSGSDTEYAATTFEESSGLAHFIGNGRDDFEMALWRQESGLGPPASSFGETRFCFRQEESPSGDQGGHGANARVHAKYMRHSGDTQASFYASALAYARNEKQHSIRQSVPQNNDVRPQIFVARPPIVAHGAMSIDKSGDYIRSTLGSSDHMLGQVVLSDSSAMHPTRSVSSYAQCRDNSPGTLSSSPPSLSSSSSTAFSDAGSSTSAFSVKRQSLGKRLRLHPTDAAAAAAVLTSLSGRTVVDEFDDDEDDDELDPYAEAFAAANRAAMPATFSGYAGFGPVADGANSAPCSSIPASLTCYPPPPLPRLANSSPSIVTTNLDDEKRS
ncbi:hypothetical protein H4R27_003092, partial [Coemansia aciculifera]